jgi:1-deoxy-D-xylulose-5-phosphate reductoisomerase
VYGTEPTAVARLILTASGGPFRTWTLEAMTGATVTDALDHPTWQMGPKITIDSATLMNKGFEVIEAHHLFDMPEERIDVVIHPQSLIHALVEWVDGSIGLQMSARDMRLAIGYALAWPERCAGSVPPLDCTALPALTFEAPDPVRFPALTLAREALRAGGEMPVVLNAANEVAVAAVLEERCAVRAVPEIVAATLEIWAARNRPLTGIEHVLAADIEARKTASDVMMKYGAPALGSERRC